MTIFSKFISIFAISMFEKAICQFLDKSMHFQLFDTRATLRAIWTNLVTIFSKSSSIFAISILQIDSVLILRQVGEFSIFSRMGHKQVKGLTF